MSGSISIAAEDASSGFPSAIKATSNALHVVITPSGTQTVDSELPAAAALADTTANPTVPTVGADNMLFNGTTWDRVRGDTTNGVDVDVTRLPALVAGTAQIGTVGMLPAAPAAANILAGRQTFTSTTAATTVITIPAGRTWVGTIGASCSCAETAAATGLPQAKALFTTAGTNVTPAAGTYFVVEARSGANAATGTTGSGGCNFGSLPFAVVAPAGNAATIDVASTNAGTASLVEACAFGYLI